LTKTNKKRNSAKEDEFAATYNAGVLKDIGYYADDATSFFQNRPALIGKGSNCRIFKIRFKCEFR
jgi:hypothetical protein